MIVRNLKKYVVFSSAILILLCCKSADKDHIDDLKKCVNESTTDITNGKDFYTLIKDIESTLLDDIKPTSEGFKKKYIQLANELHQSVSVKYEYFDKLETKHHDLILNAPAFNDKVFINCPHYVITKSGSSQESIMYKQSIKLEEIMSIGFEDCETSLEELIELTPKINFEQIGYRAPIILVFMNEIYFAKYPPQKLDLGTNKLTR